jgi:hypothetical protein
MENNVDPLQQAAKADAEAKATHECARFCKGAKHHIPLSSVIYDIAPFHLPLVFQACVFLLIKLFRAPTARTCFRLSLLTQREAENHVAPASSPPTSISSLFTQRCACTRFGAIR